VRNLDDEDDDDDDDDNVEAQRSLILKTALYAPLIVCTGLL
jgi:hypothetical protein